MKTDSKAMQHDIKQCNMQRLNAPSIQNEEMNMKKTQGCENQ